MICTCGREIALRATKIRVNGKRGVMHHLEHRDGTPPCVPGEWSCAALKPYPKNKDDSEYSKLIRRFEDAARAALGEVEREG